MSATDNLISNRDVIISIVAEYFINDDARLRQAKIAPVKEMTVRLAHIEHSQWRLWYDERKNIIYV